MRIWIVAIGEPVPVEEGTKDRLHRAGFFAHFLADKGHEVVWWTSTFDHARKKHWFEKDTILKPKENLTIRLMKSRGYKSNVSFSRILDHIEIAKRFALLIENAPKPDVIVAAYPTIELAKESVFFGKKHKIPVIIDVRDQWPDVFVELVPKPLQPIVNLFLLNFYNASKKVFKDASAVIGITEAFVKWGASRGGRSIGKYDRSIPFTYPESLFTKEEINGAKEFWQKFGIKDKKDEFIVSFIGSISRYFDFGPIVHAANILKENSIRFVICGSGDELEKIKRLASSCKNIVFPGWIDKAKIKILLEFSTLALAPYKTLQNFVYNLTNKPVEYWSFGVPVACSLNCGVLYDLIEKHQCGFIYRNAEELSKKICELMQDTQHLELLSRNARNLFESRFSFQKVCEDFNFYLHDLVRAYPESSKSLKE